MIDSLDAFNHKTLKFIVPKENMNELSKVFNGTPIKVQETNGELFFDISGVSGRYKKNITDWKNSKETLNYIEELEKSNPLDYIKVIKERGSQPKTFIHKKLLMLFARFINVKFAIWCDEIIESILIGEKSLINNQLLMKETQLKNAQKQLSEVSKNNMKTYKDGFMSLRKYIKDRNIKISQDLAIEKLLENKIIDYKEVVINKQQLIESYYGYQESEGTGIKFNPRALDELFVYENEASLFDMGES